MGHWEILQESMSECLCGFLFVQLHVKVFVGSHPSQSVHVKMLGTVTERKKPDYNTRLGQASKSRCLVVIRYKLALKLPDFFKNKEREPNSFFFFFLWKIMIKEL
jgi:hypothetical protein